MSASAVVAPQLALIRTSHWLTSEEVMQQTGWSRTTFLRERSKLLSRDSSQNGRNGRPIIEYFDGSLPVTKKAQMISLL